MLPDIDRIADNTNDLAGMPVLCFGNFATFGIPLRRGYAQCLKPFALRDRARAVSNVPEQVLYQSNFSYARFRDEPLTRYQGAFVVHVIP
jgi:hypothetical protein